MRYALYCLERHLAPRFYLLDQSNSEFEFSFIVNEWYARPVSRQVIQSTLFALTNRKRNKTMRTTIPQVFIIWLTADLMASIMGKP